MSAPFTLAEELGPILQQIVALNIFLRCNKEEQDTILADQDRLQQEIWAHRKISEAISSHLSPEFIPKKFSAWLAKSTQSSQGSHCSDVFLPRLMLLNNCRFTAAASESSLVPRIHFTRKRKAHDSQVEAGQSSAGNIAALENKPLEHNKSIVTSKKSRGIPTDENGVCQPSKRT
ncbi:uncharacterized protein ARMOST_22463 [Armillaria ostoyae]|uniref:Uncharacterized protein n=1 Tax=Armillaria ostoyae TaxID=47428 RepID=A0A284SCY3_ARMOS|nr:uncharacterized protein ARMOST_22463 [Armillaria ostoyae]